MAVEMAEDISDGTKISNGFTLPKDCRIETTVVGKICKLVDAKTNKRQNSIGPSAYVVLPLLTYFFTRRFLYAWFYNEHYRRCCNECARSF